MTATVTPQAERAIADIAARHGVSREAVLAMLFAVNNGGGTMARFTIPELGGAGVWLPNGMTVVANMFDHELKARINALCAELSELLATTDVFPPSAPNSIAGYSVGAWWPPEFGEPTVSGGLNECRYAVFPAIRRLAVQIYSVTRIFDTSVHRVETVTQHHGHGFDSIEFVSQHGTFAISSLTEV
uniref:hypothetical protein n=1 Tax=Aldersonia kunmingensis TaxID=408066 RepID=UPI0008310067